MTNLSITETVNVITVVVILSYFISTISMVKVYRWITSVTYKTAYGQIKLAFLADIGSCIAATVFIVWALMFPLKSPRPIDTLTAAISLILVVFATLIHAALVPSFEAKPTDA